ncbi:MAG: protein-export chaperone SecB [Marinifilaceae bacterium]
MEESRFQFKGFKITRSLIERKSDNSSKKISLEFSPKGIINESEANFQLELEVKIEDENKSFLIDILALANYSFENGVANISDLFYVNAPALLFPYIRAYISTLTNLSGFEAVNLPTLNLTKVGDDLKNNISIVK